MKKGKRCKILTYSLTYGTERPRVTKPGKKVNTICLWVPYMAMEV